jgi:hypothetical protein
MPSSVRKTERFKTLARDAGMADYWHAHGWLDLCHPVEKDISFATSRDCHLMMSMVLSLRCSNASRGRLGRSREDDDLSAFLREKVR